MKVYKFKIGQTVFIRAAHCDDVPGGAYIITKRLPERHGELQYGVRSSYEDYDRVVRENELRVS